MTGEEPWSGVERRQESLRVNEAVIASVRSELASVKSALYEVAEGMNAIVPREEVEALVSQERRERFRIVGALTVVVALLLTFVAFGVAQLRSVQHVAEDTKGIVEDVRSVSRTNQLINVGNRTLLAKIDCVLLAAAQLPPGSPEQQEAYGKCLEVAAEEGSRAANGGGR